MLRSRDKYVTVANGSRNWDDGQVDWLSVDNRYHCTDNQYPGVLDDGFFTHHFEYSGGLMNGRGFGCNFHNFPVSKVYSLSHYYPSGLPSEAGSATKIVAETNPSRPVVDVPAFVGELKDLPQLLQLEGGIYLKAAKTYLGTQFGWKPLVNDMLSFMNFTDEVRKRTQELQKLKQGKLVRKRKVFNESNTVGGSTWPLNSLGGAVAGRWTAVTKVRRWGYVKWRTTADLPETDADMQALARRAIFGLNLNPASAWELIPWSWLVDWAVNVGDLLNAGRNLVPAYPEVVCVCQETVTDEEYEIIHTSQEITCSDIHNKYTTKSRSRHFPYNLDATLPFLSTRQMSILGSIGVTRRLGLLSALSNARYTG